MTSTTPFKDIPAYELLKKHYKGMFKALEKLKREGKKLSDSERLVIFGIMDKIGLELEAK